jgi:hypothetical protein
VLFVPHLPYLLSVCVDALDMLRSWLDSMHWRSCSNGKVHQGMPPNCRNGTVAECSTFIGVASCKTTRIVHRYSIGLDVSNAPSKGRLGASNEGSRERFCSHWILNAPSAGMSGHGGEAVNGPQKPSPDATMDSGRMGDINNSNPINTYDSSSSGRRAGLQHTVSFNSAAGDDSHQTGQKGGGGLAGLPGGRKVS